MTACSDMDSNIINVTSEVKVTVTLVLNASFSWLEKPSKSILTSQLATCVALGLLDAASVILNLCVVFGIFCSSSLKKVILNELICYMSIACLLDCIVNVPFFLYYMKSNAWLLGPTLCGLNAVTLLYSTLLITYILGYMCMERYIALQKLCQTRSCSSVCKHRVVIATIVVITCCVIFPIAAGYIEVRAFPSRLLCNVATDKQVFYRYIIIMVFSLPIIISMIYLLSAYVKNFQGIKDINLQRTELSYTELFFEESYLWNEWQTSKFVGAIMVLFLVLELPLIITFMKPTDVPLNGTELRHMQQQNSTVQVFYPIAQITSSIEKIYCWCKFSFCLAFPLVTLILRKDIRKKLMVLMSLFRSSASIPSSTVESPVSPEECPDDFLVPQGWRRRRLSSVTYLKSPIIFGKTRSGSLQFMDLTTGIAKWKAKYDEPKSCKVDRPFFADALEDEDELTEFVSFQDFTEEEINSSELVAIPNTSKDVAVQTAQRQTQKEPHDEPCYNISNTKEQYRCVYDGRIGKGRTRINRRQSKSFTCNRLSNNYVKCKYYMTFPKMSHNQLAQNDSTDSTTTSDLLKALQIKRSSKNGMAACDLIPRGTAELLDSPTESRNIVSL